MNFAPIATLAGLIASAALFSPWIMIGYFAYVLFLVWNDS